MPLAKDHGIIRLEAIKLHNSRTLILNTKEKLNEEGYIYAPYNGLELEPDMESLKLISPSDRTYMEHDLAFNYMYITDTQKYKINIVIKIKHRYSIFQFIIIEG